MSIEENIVINTSAATVFAIYREVGRWHEWDPDTRHARLDGPLAVGSRGHIVPTRGHGVRMWVTAVEPDRAFTVDAGFPLFTMRFEHELTPLSAVSVRVAHRVSFSGLLCWPLGWLVGRQVRRGLPHTLRSLKAWAEARSAG